MDKVPEEVLSDRVHPDMLFRRFGRLQDLITKKVKGVEPLFEFVWKYFQKRYRRFFEGKELPQMKKPAATKKPAAAKKPTATKKPEAAKKPAAKEKSEYGPHNPNRWVPGKRPKNYKEIEKLMKLKPGDPQYYEVYLVDHPPGQHPFEKLGMKRPLGDIHESSKQKEIASHKAIMKADAAKVKDKGIERPRPKPKGDMAEFMGITETPPPVQLPPKPQPPVSSNKQQKQPPPDPLPKQKKKPTKKRSWTEALKTWNTKKNKWKKNPQKGEKRGKWCMPQKGSKSYKQVVALQNK